MVASELRAVKTVECRALSGLFCGILEEKIIEAHADSGNWLVSFQREDLRAS